MVSPFGLTNASSVCGATRALCMYSRSEPALAHRTFLKHAAIIVHTLTLLLRNRQSSLSPLSPFIPLPKYFESEWSYAQYRIPTQSAHISLSSTSIRTPGRDPDVADEERCVVGWIEVPSERAGARTEYQLVALTWTGGWYRLALPSTSAAPAGSASAAAAGMPGSPPRGPLSALSSSPPTAHGHAMAAQERRPRRSSSGSIFSGRGSEKGKEREKDKEKEGSQCVLLEFRRYGRWDGWA